ncbi:MAG: hypothetical protein H0T73_21730 [Ardenticatenales bacterium]|nr:hypothetical protein [Ardenticatenales bacterium]
MQHADDPWFVAMAILLVLGGLVTAYGIRDYLKEWLVLAMALPPALFKKMFGPPRH